MQAHLAGEVTPSSDIVAPSQDVLEGIMRGFTDLGVHVGITELDVRMNVMNSTDGTETQVLTDQQKEVQRGVYERVAGACLSVVGCVGMTVWVSFEIASFLFCSR
jgi:endo-1,4-beta-xylanase